MQGGFAPDESVGSASLSLVPAGTQSSHFVPQYVRSGSEMPTRGRTMHRSLVPTRGSHGPMPNTVFWRSQSSPPAPGSSYVPERPRRRAMSPRLSEMTRKLSHDIAGVSEKSEQSFRYLQDAANTGQAMAQSAMRESVQLGSQVAELQGALRDVPAQTLSSAAASTSAQMHAFANEMDRKLQEVTGGAQRQVLEQQRKELHALREEMHGLQSGSHNTIADMRSKSEQLSRDLDEQMKQLQKKLESQETGLQQQAGEIVQEVQKQLFHSQAETNQMLNDFAQKVVKQNDTQDKLAGQLSSLLEEIQTMQTTLKNVQVDQNRQQKQQDELWKEYQEWERNANEGEMPTPDNMEADPAVPSAFNQKDQHFVFGQSGPSSQPMFTGNGMQFQADQPVFSFPANQWPPDFVQKTPALNDGEGGSNQIPPQSTSHGFDPHTIFTTAQWKPKDPPCFHGKSSEDAHTWVDLVRNYFVFMNGTPRQEVAYAVNLLRDTALEWWLSYLRRNGGKYPADWSVMANAILDRFGSNLRTQTAQAQLMNIKQGARPVREYAAEFEQHMGRLDSFDESMLLNMFVWGLQPQLAQAVSLKYPTRIAQAIGHAETIELAIKASQRPFVQKSGSQVQGNVANRGGGNFWSRGRGGSRGGGRGGVIMPQIARGGKAPNFARGGARGRAGGRGGGRGVTCFNCGQIGHYAASCPSRSNNGAIGGRQNWSGGRRGRGRNGTRFAGLNAVWDANGNEYYVDDEGQIVTGPVESSESTENVPENSEN